MASISTVNVFFGASETPLLTLPGFIERFQTACISVSTMFTTLPGAWSSYMDEYPLWRTNTFATSKTTLSTTASFATTTTSYATTTKVSAASGRSTAPSSSTIVLTSVLDSSPGVSVPSMTVTAMNKTPLTTWPSTQTRTTVTSSSTTRPPVTAGSDGTTTFGTAQIIGTSIGATAGIALVAVIGLLFMRKQRRRWSRSAPIVPNTLYHQRTKIEPVSEVKAELSGVSEVPAYGLVPPGVSELEGSGHQHTQWSGVSRKF